MGAPIFRLPTRTILSPGSLERLPEQLESLACRRPLLVFDQGLAATPWPDRVLNLLSNRYDRVDTFHDVEPNPKTSTVNRAAEEARSKDIDGVFAIGGGSVMDAAKALAMLIRNDGSCLQYEGKNLFPNQPAPFVAIPTTCGTGSEVTWVSVLSDTASERKISVKGDGMFPDLALVDADLIRTLPASLIAQTGLDALTHALEAYVSLAANTVSDVLASEATRLLLSHLALCVEDPDNPSHREPVMRASTLAGMAFGNADVGAVHCLSESIGGLYDHPHGLLNAQLLVPVFKYQFEVVREKLSGMIAGVDALALLERIESLVARLKLPTVESLELPPGAHKRISELAAINNSNDSNPLRMTPADYERIMTSVAAAA